MRIPETEITITRGTDVLARYTVQPGDYVIGRDGADISIDDAFLSERHAQLTVNYQELLIEDLGSEGGTFINERPVTKPTRLWPGQKVRLGTVVLEAHRVKVPRAPDETIAPVTATVRRLLPQEFLHEQKYQIGSVVAHGGMGAILDAQEVSTRRKVAMKVMLQTDSETDLHRFVEEAQVTAQLEHPNIVPVHELGVDEQEQVFYTMKYVRGITLKKVIGLLARGFEPAVEKYSLALLLTILQKVCDAIAFAHSRGVIHRDLKPENIMIGDYGEVLVMDWGLAKVLHRGEDGEETEPAEHTATLGEIITARAAEKSFATMVGTIVGTPQYMSPEQAVGAVEMLDTHTDIYALGAILYSILALRPPVNGTTPEQVLDNVRFGRIRPLKGAMTKVKTPLPHLPGGRVPESLEAVAMKALALSPEQRYHSVTDLQADIAAYQNGFATGAEQAGLIRQMILLVARRKSEAAILAACAAVLLAIGPFFYLKVVHQRNAAVALQHQAETESERTEEQLNLAQSERDRANAALATVRKAAPVYDSQARELANRQDFAKALERIAFAQSITPEAADYELFRAHLLQAMQRLPEAIDAYRKVLSLQKDHSAAQTNLDLCEALLKANGGALPLSATHQGQLLEAIKQQRRNAEAVWLAYSIGRESEVALELIESRLSSIMAQPRWTSFERLRRRQDGTFEVNLSNLAVPDLEVLRGLPISDLTLENCGATDISPLADIPSLRKLDLTGLAVGEIPALSQLPLRRLVLHKTNVQNLNALSEMPLEHLTISGTPVSDLSPISGKRLTQLDLSGATRITNFSALSRMPLKILNLAGTNFTRMEDLPLRTLRTLRLAGTKITGVEVLAGSQVQQLDLSACANLKDLTPLETCEFLESLLIPTQCRDLSFLDCMPRLRRVSYQGLRSFENRFDHVTLFDEFLKEHRDRSADPI